MAAPWRSSVAGGGHVPVMGTETEAASSRDRADTARYQVICRAVLSALKRR